MSPDHPTPWQAKISDAIVNFPSWGRLRPRSVRGHAITALAFYDWSEGGLGVFGCEATSKSIGLYLYACTFTVERFQAVFVDWKTGWCNHTQHSNNRFVEDAAGGSDTVYAYSIGGLDAAHIQFQREALNNQDKALVLVLKKHLDNVLGEFDWTVWLSTAVALADRQDNNVQLSFVRPVALESGKYLLPIRDPYIEDSIWPTGLSGNELCNYLGASSRENGAIEFFAFQERMDMYLKNNPTCVWDTSHSIRLVELFGSGNRYKLAAHFFGVWEHDSTWPAPSTRVIAPWFTPYAQSFVDTMQHSEKDQLDAAWIAASHFAPSSKNFNMFETVFKGYTVLDGNEVLSFGTTSFRLSGRRGERGSLLAINSTSNSLDCSASDALRQARAWCGGIMAVDASLVEQAPLFWKSQFERREVAALLDHAGHAVCSHPHFYYAKAFTDVPHAMTRRNPHAAVEYSLFQENPQMWRSMQSSGTLECAWGWRLLFNQGPVLYCKPTPFPKYGTGEPYQLERQWREMRERWLHTMGPGDAAAVYTLLRVNPSWPTEADEYKILAEHYLRNDPAIFAVCDMMDFDPDGVLTALRRSKDNFKIAKNVDIVSPDTKAMFESSF